MKMLSPANHIRILYLLIASLMVLSYQRHAKLQTTMTILKEFQSKSSETRLYLIEEIDELQNRIAVLEGGHGNVQIRTIRPHNNATGNRK